MTNNLMIRLGRDASNGWRREPRKPRDPLARFVGLQAGRVLRRWMRTL